jgi:hypothetical protein
MKEFDLPAATVPFDDLYGISQTGDRTVGQEKPLNGFLDIVWGIIFPNEHSV